ncbi:hypothetical protein HaLaN_32217, partial [Haematococcus lacustris]
MYSMYTILSTPMMQLPAGAQQHHGEEAAGSDPLAGTRPGHQGLGNGDMVGPPSA